MFSAKEIFFSIHTYLHENQKQKDIPMAKRKEEKRIDSTKEYIDALQEKYSKLCVVRVDLSYKKPYSGTILLDEATKDLNHLFNNMRSKPTLFKDKVGYVCKKEHTDSNGVHFHVAILYDGNKVQKDAFKGDEIGKYWKQITQQKGSYHNCNRNEYEQHGIGMIDHRDSDKRKILDEKVLSYLCKDEQNIKPVKEDAKEKAFTRGTLPKKDSKKGRPRN